jgi:hypothetical protein
MEIGPSQQIDPAWLSPLVLQSISRGTGPDRTKIGVVVVGVLVVDEMRA